MHWLLQRKAEKNHASTQYLNQACIGGPIFKNAIQSYLCAGLTNSTMEELEMLTNR